MRSLQRDRLGKEWYILLGLVDEDMMARAPQRGCRVRHGRRAARKMIEKGRDRL